MRIHILYAGSLDEDPEKLANIIHKILQSECIPGTYWAESRRGSNPELTRRHFAAISGFASAIAISGGFFVTQPARAQGRLIESKISNVDVARPIIPPRNKQTSIAELRNESNEVRRGIVSADYRANGTLTDQGYHIATIAPLERQIARIDGDVGSATGNGITNVFTQLGSRSKTYQIR